MKKKDLEKLNNMVNNLKQQQLIKMQQAALVKKALIEKAQQQKIMSSIDGILNQNIQLKKELKLAQIGGEIDNTIKKGRRNPKRKTNTRG